ncbi:MAG: prepilin-type N-terminal cleavage/methylation domain-containing protein [Deltaproteobacteria bacterium]|nr:prepilin-type N-terminal cleavage/methylation domain-containing protein [Deltaproteobacteria bacterium]
MDTKSKNQKGFTLIELAIVLVIIGIILGAVLKGQEMINSAKIKNVGEQYRSLMAAVYSYQDKYQQFPGDDNAATSRSWATGKCETTSGNGNGQITEYYAAAEHLACAGLIAGSYNGTSENIKHKYGGDVLIYYDAIQGKTGNLIRFDNLSAENAQAVDAMVDDGIYNSGTCRASAAYTAGTTIAQLVCFI